MLKTMTFVLMFAAVGCADLQRATERPDDRAAREASERRAQQPPPKAPTRDPRADYLAKRDEAVRTVTETAEFTSVVNGKCAGRTVRVQARMHEVMGDVAFVDGFGGSGSVMVELIPPYEIAPTTYFALEYADWQEKQVFYEGLKHGLVTLVVAVPATPQQPCIARLLDVRAARP